MSLCLVVCWITSSLHRSMLDQEVFVHLLDKTLVTRIPDGSKLLPSMDNAGHSAHWEFQCCWMFSEFFPRSVSWLNPVLEVYRLSWTFLAVHFRTQAYYWTSYRQVCAFPNQAVGTSDRWSAETGCKAMNAYVHVICFFFDIARISTLSFLLCVKINLIYFGLLL